MFEEFASDVLIPALYAIAVAVFPIVTGYLIDAIRKWAANQKAEWLRTVVEGAAASAERAMEAVDQTFVKDMRSPQGKLGALAGRKAMNLALVEAQKQLGEDGMRALEKALGGPDQADAAIVSMIEAALGKKKTTERRRSEDQAQSERRSSDEFVGQ